MNLNFFLTQAASLLSSLGIPERGGITWVTSNWQIEHQRPFTIEWAGHTRPVTITLVGRVNDRWIRVWEVTANNEEDSFVFKTPHVIQQDVEYAFNISDAGGKSTLSPRWQVDLEARQVSSLSLIGQPDATSTEPPNEAPTQPPTVSTTQSAAGAPNEASRGPEATRGQSASPSATESAASSNGSSSGLSSGAYIGIGIGAALGGVLIIGLLVWFLLRRKRAQKKQPQDGGDGLTPGQAQTPSYPEMQAQQAPQYPGQPPQLFEAGHGEPRRAELHGQDNEPKIGELESSYLRYAELPAKP